MFPKKDIALAVSLLGLNHALFNHLEQQSFGETLKIWNSNKRFLSIVRKEKRRKYIRYLDGQFTENKHHLKARKTTSLPVKLTEAEQRSDLWGKADEHMRPERQAQRQTRRK